MDDKSELLASTSQVITLDFNAQEWEKEKKTNKLKEDNASIDVPPQENNKKAPENPNFEK